MAVTARLFAPKNIRLLNWTNELIGVSTNILPFFFFSSGLGLPLSFVYLCMHLKRRYPLLRAFQMHFLHVLL